MLLTTESFRDLLRLLVNVGEFSVIEADKIIKDATKNKDYAVRVIERTVRLTNKTKGEK